MLGDLKPYLYSIGADLVGFADIGPVAEEDRNGLPRAVSIAVALNPNIASKIGRGPTREYWDEYKRVNERLTLLARNTAGYLAGEGYKAEALLSTFDHLDLVTNTPVSYDPTTLSTKLPHKTAATLSGLGWIGKCALLVTPQFGSAVRLTAVLTDANLRVDKARRRSQCASCTACVDACPGHAPSGKSWTWASERQSFFDAYACRKTADKQARRAGIEDTICGICINACPWTQRYLAKTLGLAV
jgi:epoxyqueuosine reductase QueG